MSKKGCDQQEKFWERWSREHLPNAKSEVSVDPEKKIALQKVMVGHYIETIPEDNKKNVVYVVQGDGIYERRINKLGQFTTKLVSAEIPGLHSNLKEEWILNVPKIPASLLGTTISFFRKVYEKFSSEVFIQFFYDPQNGYILHCPKQTVGGASVNYDNDEMMKDKDKILVFEIHSHGRMNAFFSGTDDRDEKADRFYGVIGNIGNFFPDLKFRLSIGGKKIDVSWDDIFELDEEVYHSETFPKGWFDNIKEEKKCVVGIRKFNKESDIPPGAIPLWDEDQLNEYMGLFKDSDHLFPKNECYSDDEVEIEYIRDGVSQKSQEDHRNYWEKKEANIDPKDWRNKRF